MKFFYTAALTLCLTAAAAAQSPSKILKQAEKALGGSKALLALQHVTKTGRITRMSDSETGHYTLRASQPNLFDLDLDLGGLETETGYNGRSGWTRNSRDGMQTLTSTAGDRLQAKAVFRNRMWLSAKNDKSKIVSGGVITIDGKPANCVVITNTKAVAIKICFDAASSLPVRDEIPGGEAVEITDYSDYRDVGGLKQAFANKITSGDQVYQVRFDDIRTDQAIAASEYNFPVLSNEPLPDVPALLREVQTNADRVEGLLDTYSYSQKVIKRELGKDGFLRETGSETYQMSFYKGHRMRRLIEKNGKPLDPKDQADEDKEAEKRATDIEKRLAKQEAKGEAEAENSRRISIAEMLRASRLVNPRRERFGGRDCVVFDFEPDPAFDLKNAKSMIKFFGKTTGVMWVDERDKQVARVEAVLADSISMGGGVLAKLKKGATFTLENQRVNHEIWLPAQADLNLSVRVFLVKGIDINQVVRSYDYRKFATEVKDAKVDEVKKPD